MYLFFFKQKTAYELRISDWSSDVCSSDLVALAQFHASAHDMHSFAVIETAGGVLSPGPSSALQADLYRPFRHPVVLVGDTRLGGITSTLTALEALTLRGFNVHAVCMILQQGATSLINTEIIRQVSFERCCECCASTSETKRVSVLRVVGGVFLHSALPS